MFSMTLNCNSCNNTVTTKDETGAGLKDQLRGTRRLIEKGRWNGRYIVFCSECRRKKREAKQCSH